MSMLINGTNVVDTFEIWTVKRRSTDGEEVEIAFPEGDEAARLDQKVYGGKIFVRTCYVAEGTDRKSVV